MTFWLDGIIYDYKYGFSGLVFALHHGGVRKYSCARVTLPFILNYVNVYCGVQNPIQL